MSWTVYLGDDMASYSQYKHSSLFFSIILSKRAVFWFIFLQDIFIYLDRKQIIFLPFHNYALLMLVKKQGRLWL